MNRPLGKIAYEAAPHQVAWNDLSEYQQNKWEAIAQTVILTFQKEQIAKPRPTETYKPVGNNTVPKNNT
jgi:hypothetical protein